MPKIFVSKSEHINATPEAIFPKLNDFHEWPKWSPWLIQDPEATVDVAEDGKSYSWQGKRVGSGEMSVISETKDEYLNCDLTFLTPYKSTAKTSFKLTPRDGGTEVTWTMDSSLPFFMFWMKKSMEAFIGSDYDRGLAMLKELSEDGTVHSSLDFKGESEFAGCDYIGKTTHCTIDEVGLKMQADFAAVGNYSKENEDNIAGIPFSIYHKWDMVKRNVSYTAATPVKKLPTPLPAGMIVGKIPATRIYTLRHIGSYKHLGNAWTTLYGMVRAKTFKVKKGIHPFEIYQNMPGEVPDEELITDINFAIK
ncbi:MAG: hypothetical protein HKN87_15565 [Saprospiraceae bacterium]|nr:hypothetical protein [Saprospiraceae bacterium]